MSSYNSKYTGAEVEALLDKVDDGIVYYAAGVFEAAKNGTMTSEQFDELAQAVMDGKTIAMMPSFNGSYATDILVTVPYLDWDANIVKLVAVTNSSDDIALDIYVFNGNSLTVDVIHETVEQKYSSATSSSGTVVLSDTKMLILGEQSAVTITLPSGAEDNGREYLCQFTASASGCTLSVPDTITWLGGETPTINAGKTYQLSIVNNLAVIGEF